MINKDMHTGEAQILAELEPEVIERFNVDVLPLEASTV